MYKTVGDRRTLFAWDGDALIAESINHQKAREYVYYPGTFESLAVIDADKQLYYYHNGINGLPQELTCPEGRIVWSATYHALGHLQGSGWMKWPSRFACRASTGIKRSG